MVHAGGSAAGLDVFEGFTEFGVGGDEAAFGESVGERSLDGAAGASNVLVGLVHGSEDARAEGGQVGVLGLPDGVDRVGATAPHNLVVEIAELVDEVGSYLVEGAGVIDPAGVGVQGAQ